MAMTLTKEEAEMIELRTALADARDLLESYRIENENLLTVNQQLRLSNEVLTADRSAQRWAVESGLEKGKRQVAEDALMNARGDLEACQRELAAALDQVERLKRLADAQLDQIVSAREEADMFKRRSEEEGLMLLMQDPVGMVRMLAAFFSEVLKVSNAKNYVEWRLATDDGDVLVYAQRADGFSPAVLARRRRAYLNRIGDGCTTIVETLGRDYGGGIDIPWARIIEYFMQMKDVAREGAGDRPGGGEGE